MITSPHTFETSECTTDLKTTMHPGVGFHCKTLTPVLLKRGSLQHWFISETVNISPCSAFLKWKLYIPSCRCFWKYPKDGDARQKREWLTLNFQAILNLISTKLNQEEKYLEHFNVQNHIYKVYKEPWFSIEHNLITLLSVHRGKSMVIWEDLWLVCRDVKRSWADIRQQKSACSS